MTDKKQFFLKRKYIEMQSRWAQGIDSVGLRLFAHFDAIFGDHALLRLMWFNQHQLTPSVLRSNQPSPRRIKHLATRYGIKTIINLRGPSRWGSYALEKEACKQYGVTLIDHRMYSRRMPSFEELKALKAMFDTLEGPVLFHCKSGADRAGICSALYVLLKLNGSIDEAIAQLSLRYLHFKHSKTGRLDFFLESYRDFARSSPMDIMQWAEHHYDKEKLTKNYHSNRWFDWVVDKVLNRE